MAIMHPLKLDNYDPTPSERVFFEELEKQLDSSYHVFYSVKWYSKDHKNKRINSECDFLIFNSNFGYLTIEVKGGTSIEINDRHWILHYIDKYGLPAKRDLGKGPYDQADRSMYYFYDYYRKETFSKFQGSYEKVFDAVFDRMEKNDAQEVVQIIIDECVI